MYVLGIHCFFQNDSYESLQAVIPGPKETPYEEIQFKISMEFDSQYPFQPPIAKFVTPVYHPNIDTGKKKSKEMLIIWIEKNGTFSDGKICLDVLRMPPGGSYNPAITLESILLSIQLLLSSPNPDDPLRDDVSDEYRYNRELFNKNAKKYSGTDESEAGHCSKKSKTENIEISKSSEDSSVKSIGDDDEIGENYEPETSGGILATLKPNRKRKHDET